MVNNIIGDINPYAKKKIQGPERTETQTKQTAKSGSDASDKVQFSNEARLRGAALQAATEAPDVRRQKVDALKEQVQNGTYQPDIKKAAANLIRDDLDLLV